MVRINWAFQNLGHGSLTQPVSGGLAHGIHLTESEEKTVLFPSPFPGVCFLSEFLNFKKYPSAHKSEFLRSREFKSYSLREGFLFHHFKFKQGLANL